MLGAAKNATDWAGGGQVCLFSHPPLALCHATAKAVVGGRKLAQLKRIGARHPKSTPRKVPEPTHRVVDIPPAPVRPALALESQCCWAGSRGRNVRLRSVRRVPLPTHASGAWRKKGAISTRRADVHRTLSHAHSWVPGAGLSREQLAAVRAALCVAGAHGVGLLNPHQRGLRVHQQPRPAHDRQPHGEAVAESGAPARTRATHAPRHMPACIDGCWRDIASLLRELSPPRWPRPSSLSRLNNRSKRLPRRLQPFAKMPRR